MGLAPNTHGRPDQARRPNARVRWADFMSFSDPVIDQKHGADPYISSTPPSLESSKHGESAHNCLPPHVSRFFRPDGTVDGRGAERSSKYCSPDRIRGRSA